MSTSTRSPARWASLISAPASSMVPNIGWIPVKSLTSYPPSAIGEGYHGEIQMPSTPSSTRYGSRARMPAMSPFPSPFPSAKLRG